MQKEWEVIFFHDGYRYFKVIPEETGVFYKFQQEGFHAVILVDLEHGYSLTPKQLKNMEERVKELLFHPQGRIAGFPEGYPVYHVDVLTLLVGGEEDAVRRLCVECRNVWAYQPACKRLLIYENQPGDFWGLKTVIESKLTYYDVENRIKKTLGENIRSIRKQPYITIMLVVANAVVYLILEIMGNTESASFIASHGGMYPEFILYNNQWWRILTAMFIHFGAVHLLNNMVIFCLVGARLERAVGHIRLLLVYIISGIGGGLLSYYRMLYTGDYAVAAGASGAVFGTIGGLLWAVILHRGHFEELTTKGLIGMLALSLYYGFSTIGIDNWSHIGGMVTGFVSAFILYHRKSQKC